jgi:hypothetical protein
MSLRLTSCTPLLLLTLGAAALACSEDTSEPGSDAEGGNGGQATPAGGNDSAAEGGNKSGGGSGGQTSNSGAGSPNSGGGGQNTAGETLGGAGGEQPGGGGSGGEPEPEVDCSQIIPAPIELETDFAMGLDGSEDIAFDGKGNLTASRGDEVVLVDAQAQVTPLSANGVAGQKFGRRFLSTGELVIASPALNSLMIVDAAGEERELLGGLQTPNGVHVDSADNVWVTQTGGAAITKVTLQGDPTPAVTIDQPNGVFLDERRGFLFYDTLNGEVKKVQVTNFDVVGDSTDVADIEGRLDGIDMDACGNLYVVDVQGSRLFRVMLDEEGERIGDPELLFDAPGYSLANAQFGRGEGFDELSIYGTGNAGRISRAVVGVPGYPLDALQAD